jgi:hypothetical protein
VRRHVFHPFLTQGWTTVALLTCKSGYCGASHPCLSPSTLSLCCSDLRHLGGACKACGTGRTPSETARQIQEEEARLAAEAEALEQRFQDEQERRIEAEDEILALKKRRGMFEGVWVSRGWRLASRPGGGGFGGARGPSVSRSASLILVTPKARRDGHGW